MKKVVGLFFIAVSVGAYGQKKTFSDNLFVANAENKIETADFSRLKNHLTYLSSNYEKVFGEFNFSYDSNNFGSRNVYVGYSDRLYYQGNSAFIMENPGVFNSGNFVWNNDYLTGLLSGVKLIFNTEKNYTKSYSGF